MTKEEWHKYFVRNKENFTSSELESLMKPNKIYVQKIRNFTESPESNECIIEDFEEGNWNPTY